MFLALLICVPLVLFLVWAVVYDLRRRRVAEPMSHSDSEASLRRTRVEGEGKSAEWGIGG